MNSNSQTSETRNRQTFSQDWQPNGKPIVLVVEDHDDTREMLDLLLSGYGYRVIAAKDGEQAMSLAEKIPPDLIVMDIKMPLLDGLTLTRIIRSHPLLHQVPILAVSGMVTPQFQREALTAGCNHCLEKPIDFELLEELVKELARPTPRLLTHRMRYPLAVIQPQKSTRVTKTFR